MSVVKHLLIFLFLFLSNFCHAQIYLPAHQELVHVQELIKEEKYETALTEIETILPGIKNNDKVKISALTHMALCLQKTGEYEKALEVYGASDEMIKKSKLEPMPEEAINTDGIGVCYYELSDYISARHTFEAELFLNKKIFGEIHPHTAKNYNNLGNCFSDRGILDTALIYYHQALDTYRKCGAIKSLDAAMTYKNIGRTLNYAEKYWESIKYLDTCLNIRKQIYGDRKNINLADAYINLGKTFNSLNELDKALYYHKLALQTLENNNIPEKFQIATALADIGHCYYDMGDYQKALLFYNHALTIRIAIFAAMHPNLALNYAVIGNCHAALGNYVEGVSAYQKSIESIAEAFGQTNSNEAYLHLLLGKLYLKMGDIDQAEKQVNNAVPILLQTSTTDLSMNVSCDNLIALIALERKNFEVAQTNFEAALKKNNYDQTADNPEISNLNEFITTIIGLIRLNHSEYLATGEIKYLENCQHWSKAGIQQMTEKINSTFFYDTKFFYKDIFRSIFSESLKSLKKADGSIADPELFFSFLEQSKSSLLQNQIREREALFENGIPDSLVNLESAIDGKIQQLEMRINNMKELGTDELNEKMLKASEQLFAYKQQKSELINQLKNSYHAKATNAKPIPSLREIRGALLTEEQCIIEYFFTDSSVFIFMIAKDTMEIVEQKEIKEVRKMIALMRDGINGYFHLPLDERNDDTYKKTVLDYAKSSYKLYNLLLVPIVPLLKKEIIIVPDKELYFIPFGALTDSPPQKATNFNTYDFLVKNHIISYAFSAAQLFSVKNKKTETGHLKTIAAFAPFSHQSIGEALEETEANIQYLPPTLDSLVKRGVTGRGELYQLPSSGEEASGVAAVMGGEAYLGNKASKNKFQEVAEISRILHLSTHGQANNYNGDYSSLAFAGPKEDNLLYAKEIYPLDIRAELVVLSACETAIGEIRKGEGVVSMAKAFMYAGAKSTVNTLWAVEDNSTKELMTEFYHQIKAGEKKNRALQTAKENILKNGEPKYKHPFFWAGVTLWGDTGKLTAN